MGSRPDILRFERRLFVDNVIFKRDAFRVVLCEPCIGSAAVREDLEVIAVADLLPGIDINPDRFHLTIL